MSDAENEVKLTVTEERKIEEIEIEEGKIPEGILAAIANKYDSGKKEAILASARRVSKRMLMSARVKKVTLVCPITGIISLLDMPSVPGCYLPYEHPISTLENARAIAQKGPSYLSILDTRTLAGILIVLADSYELFRFLPADTGAEKNAILRTAGKETIIDAIIFIEKQVNSRTKHYCPTLSLLPDAICHKSDRNADIRLHNYLSLLTESFRKQDTTEYDPNKAPKKVGRPVFIRDVLKAEKKLSYLARLEQSAAKKQLLADAKEAKKLASNIVALGLLKEKFKPFISQLLMEDGMGLVKADKSLIEMLIVQKLEYISHESKDVVRLIEILRKDRKILSVELMELDELDDPKPGQEDSISSVVTETVAEEENAEEIEEEEEEAIAGEAIATVADPIPPADLSPLQRILWLKKHHVRTSTYSQPKAPEVKHVYTRTEHNSKNEPLHFTGYSKNRLFIVYSNSQISTGAYYIMDNFGDAILALTTLPYGWGLEDSTEFYETDGE